MRYLRRLKYKKGFTLVELLVATAITSILLVAAMSLFTPVRNIAGQIEGDVTTDNITTSMNNYIASRLNKACAFNIDSYTNEELIQAPGNAAQAGPAWRLDKLVSNAEGSISAGTIRYYAMMLKDDGLGYRIYDFGECSSNSTGIHNEGQNLFAKIGNYEVYSLFEDAYYNNRSFKFTFNTPQSNWCEVGTTAFNMDGQVEIQERKTIFKVLNLIATAGAVSQPALATYDENYPDGETIVIVYAIADYTTYTGG